MWTGCSDEVRGRGASLSFPAVLHLLSLISIFRLSFSAFQSCTLTLPPPPSPADRPLHNLPSPTRFLRHLLPDLLQPPRVPLLPRHVAALLALFTLLPLLLLGARCATKRVLHPHPGAPRETDDEGTGACRVLGEVCGEREDEDEGWEQSVVGELWEREVGGFVGRRRSKEVGREGRKGIENGSPLVSLEGEVGGKERAKQRARVPREKGRQYSSKPGGGRRRKGENRSRRFKLFFFP